MPALNCLDQAEKVPIGYQSVDCYMVIDIKKDFTWTLQFLAWRQMLETPALPTNPSVLSQESVRIAFIVTVLQ